MLILLQPNFIFLIKVHVQFIYPHILGGCPGGSWGLGCSHCSHFLRQWGSGSPKGSLFLTYLQCCMFLEERFKWGIGGGGFFSFTVCSVLLFCVTLKHFESPWYEKCYTANNLWLIEVLHIREQIPVHVCADPTTYEDINGAKTGEEWRKWRAKEDTRRRGTYDLDLNL